MRKLISLIFTLALVLESAGLVFSASGKSQKGGWSGNKYVQIREVTLKKTAKPTPKADTSVRTGSSKQSNSPAYRTGSGTRKSYKTVRKPYKTRRYYRTGRVYTYKKPQPQTVQKPAVSQAPEQLGFTGVVSSYDVGGRLIVMSSSNRLIRVSVPRDVDIRMPGHGFIDISEIPPKASVKVKGILTGADTVEARFVEVWGSG